MKYMGSKNRIARYLIPIIFKNSRPFENWVEPFVGGANMIDKVPDRYKKIGGDCNYYIVEYLKAIRDGWAPPQKISEQDYLKIKKHKKAYEPCLVGFAGVACSFGSVFFSGYASDKNKNNYAKMGRHNAIAQAPDLKNVMFFRGDYRDLPIPKNSLIYCDPPYQSATKYKDAGVFDHPVFWGWCRQKIKEGQQVYISEHAAPPDFIEIFAKEIPINIAGTQEHTRVEKLFIHESQIKKDAYRFKELKQTGFNF